MPPRSGYKKLASYPAELRDKVQTLRDERDKLVDRRGYLTRKLKASKGPEDETSGLRETISCVENEIATKDQQLNDLDNQAVSVQHQNIKKTGDDVDRSLDVAAAAISQAQEDRQRQKRGISYLGDLAGVDPAAAPALDDSAHALAAVSASQVPGLSLSWPRGLLAARGEG